MNFKKAFQGIRREKKIHINSLHPIEFNLIIYQEKFYSISKIKCSHFFLWKALLNSMQRLHAHSTHHSILWLGIYIYISLPSWKPWGLRQSLEFPLQTWQSECLDFSKQLRNECKKASICNIFILIEAKIACQ